MIDKLYQGREARDTEFKRLKDQGLNPKKYTVRNQLLHPMYVEDLKAGLTEEDCGFGNTIYQTHFKVLYGVKDSILVRG